MESSEPDACTSCGLVDPGGWPACEALFEKVRLREISDHRYGALGRTTVDTYCVQHEEHYCGRPVGLVAHLGGLCVAVEYDGHPSVYQALQRWLDRARRTIQYPPEPGIPTWRGSITIGDVHRALSDTPEAYHLAVQRWAHATWDAFTILQPLSRGWIEEALNFR